MLLLLHAGWKTEDQKEFDSREAVAFCLFSWSLNVPAKSKLNVRDRPTQTILCAAILKNMLQIKLVILLCHSILTMSQ